MKGNYMSNNLLSNKYKIRKMTVTAMFCALSYLCVFILRFKIGFLTFDVKDSITTIASMLLGPVYGVSIAFIVSFLEFISISDTGVYGLIFNFISSATFAGTAGIIYKYKKNMFGALIGLSSASVLTTSIMLLANLLLTPYYMGVTVSEVVAMIPKMLLPFNLLKTTINTSLVLVFYKSVSRAMKKICVDQCGISERRPTKKMTIIMLTMGIVLLVVSILIFVFKFDGEFTFLRK
jgi:riboflavin transporter FmnP